MDIFDMYDLLDLQIEMCSPQSFIYAQNEEENENQLEKELFTGY